MRILKPLAITGCLLLVAACNSDDDPLEGKDFDYIVVNTGGVDIGIRTIVNVSATDYALLEKEIVLAPGEEQVILKAAEQKEPLAFINSIEVYDKSFTEKFKTLDLSKRSVTGNATRMAVWMPHPNGRDVTAHNVGVRVHMDATSVFGYFPKNELTNETSFFSTADEFKILLKFQMPPADGYYSTVRIFGNTIIAVNAIPTLGNTTFVRSDNKGISWSQMLHKVNNGYDEFFMTADFVTPDEGWFFTYNYHDSTSVYKVDDGSYSQIASLKGYCILDCAFMDSNKGYAIGNTKDNTMPATSPNTYLFKTEDGGVTWSDPILISSTEWPLKLYAFPSGRLYVMRNNTYVMHRTYYQSSDDGETWQIIETQIDGNIRDIYFMSANVGFIKTGDEAIWSSSNSGFLYKTTDGGATWNKISTAMLGSSVYFYDEENGYLQDLIYGKGQVLLVTRDGGQTWKELLYPYGYLSQ